MGVRRRRRGGDESLCRPAAKTLSATAAQDDRSHAVIWRSGQATRLSSIHRSRRGYLGAISPASALRHAHSRATRCVYCGHCNHYGCHVNAKASTLHTAIPVALQTGNLDLRTNCKVANITTDDRGLVTGVKYFDPSGVLQEQRARVVILSAFVFEHVRLLLLSKCNSKRFKNGLANSSGLVGKCFFGHGDMRVY